MFSVEKKSNGWKDSTSLIQVRSAALLMLALEVVRGSPCTVTSQYADCNRQRLVNIPRDLPSNITSLYLDDNLIESVKAGELQRLGQLQNLRINNNRIKSVDVEAFAHLTQLLKVHLSHNEISHVTNTMFTKNTRLTDFWINGNNFRVDPATPLLISTSIEYLQLTNCGIWHISNATFSKMDNLKFLFISENNIIILDSASFNYNSLRELYIDPAEEIEATLNELCRKNVTVNVRYNLNLQSFCKGNRATDTITKYNLSSPKEMPTSPKIHHYATSATPKENVTTTECDKKTVSLDAILVLVSASLVLVTIGVSVTVLLLYWRKEKSKTEKGSERPLQQSEDKPEVYEYTSPEYQRILYDFHEEPRRDVLHMHHPQRPLPHPPLYPPPPPDDSYHEYEVTLAALLLVMVDGSPCNVTSQSAICSNQGIERIPQDLPASITILNLNENRIEAIIAGDLQRFTQLQVLYMRSNHISSVDEEAFLPLRELSHVDLSSNNLTNISKDIFKQNVKLSHVILNENQLWFNPTSPFLISSSIRHLELEECGISHITSVTFSEMENLEMLSIFGNNILSLDPASFRRNSLQELYIDPGEEIWSTLTKLCSGDSVVYFSGGENFCKGLTPETTRKMELETTIREETMTLQEEAELTTENNAKKDETQKICVDRTLVLFIAAVALVIISVPVMAMYHNCRLQNNNKKEDSRTPTKKVNTTDDYILVIDAPGPQKQPLLLPSEDAPQRPLPRPPPQSGWSHEAYHVYEEVQCR